MIRLGDEQLEKAIISLREYGEQLAKAESDYEYYSSMMKAEVFLASANQGLTVKDREAMAETNKEVVAYIDMIREKKKDYICLRHKISSVMESCNLFRTKSANIRGEKKLYGELG
jgi:aspartyl-tRNA synthetase